MLIPQVERLSSNGYHRCRVILRRETMSSSVESLERLVEDAFELIVMNWKHSDIFLERMQRITTHLLIGILKSRTRE